MYNSIDFDFAVHMSTSMILTTLIQAAMVFHEQIEQMYCILEVFFNKLGPLFEHCSVWVIHEKCMIGVTQRTSHLALHCRSNRIK